MIVNCNKCDKRFNLEVSLIPKNGRLLKCGNCGNEWFFSNEFNKESTNLNNNNLYDNELINDKKENLEPISKKSNIKIKINEEDQEPNTIQNKSLSKIKRTKKKSIISKNILGKMLIFLITLIGVIFLIDTFKLYIANFFPNIIEILNNLYATLYDLKLFFKDLFR